MEITEVRQDKPLKTVVLSIRTTEENRDFIKKNKISVSKLFDKCIKELMKQENN